MPATSPHTASGGAGRAPLMRRQSSQSSQTSKHVSPGSAGEHHPLRHPVKPARHTKIVLPRNHNSGRNLPKMARQAQSNHNAAGEEGRKNSRQKSHDDDPEIRLPGSLDEAKAPPMKRNLTASQLPRNTSYTKLKKNLSHGHLTRLGSGKNLVALNSTAKKGPPSPALKGRKKRPKSEDFGSNMKDLQLQGVEVTDHKDGKSDAPKKVGFTFTSPGDSDADDAPEMEGSGLQEDEWTDQSTSASPFSTRQNTANNSRRTSVVIDRQAASTGAQGGKGQPPAARGLLPDTETESGEDDDEPPSPHGMPQAKIIHEELPKDITQASSEAKAPPRSPLHAAKDHPNPAARHLLNRISSSQSPAPALVSNVSAMDDVHSIRGSPAASMRSSRSHIGEGSAEQDQEQEELVSRFIPSASHPSTGSGGNTTLNTPKSGSLHTPEEDSTLAAQHRDKPKSTTFQLTPVSPGSTRSASSGVVTPAMTRSRTEQRLYNEKTIAEIEDAAQFNPVIPPHVFDRRNESLRSEYNLEAFGSDGRAGLAARGPRATMGPELFEGRFRAVNMELKVVQRFRDPIAESVSRLQLCKGTKFAQLRAQKHSIPAGQQQQQRGERSAKMMPISKSAVALPKQASNLSTSTSPPQTKASSPVKPAMSSVKSATQLKPDIGSRRSRVTFSQTPPETHEAHRHYEDEEEARADVTARQLWAGVVE